MKVDVFISWSGAYSSAIAEVISDWMVRVLQFARPYYSANHIDKGSRWSSEISKQLEKTNIGLIIVTPENINSSWILFEAGALSRKIDQSRVCPLLFNVEPVDIQGPLAQFQMAKFSEKEIFKVIQMINLEAGEFSLASELLLSVFNQWWPGLSKNIDDLKGSNFSNQAPKRETHELSTEILEKLRNIELATNEFNEFLVKQFRSIEELIGVFEKLVFKAVQMASENPNSNLDTITLELLNPVNAIVTNIARYSNKIDEIDSQALIQRFNVIKKLVLDVNQISNE